VTRGKPELPDDWQLHIATTEARGYFLPVANRNPQPDERFGMKEIDLREFVVEGAGDYVWTCRAWCDLRQRVLVVTPVERRPKYDAMLDAIGQCKCEVVYHEENPPIDNTP
jgi:hypothetical protein